MTGFIYCMEQYDRNNQEISDWEWYTVNKGKENIDKFLTKNIIFDLVYNYAVAYCANCYTFTNMKKEKKAEIH